MYDTVVQMPTYNLDGIRDQKVNRTLMGCVRRNTALSEHSDTRVRSRV